MSTQTTTLPAPSALTYTAIDQFCDALRAAGRHELVHYAGASHRDIVAWHMCSEWLAHPEEDEAQLKSRALKLAYGWEVPAERIRRLLPDQPKLDRTAN